MGSFKNIEACPDFDQIWARFGSDFGQIFGEVFDEGFGQVFWSRKYSVQFYRDTEIQFYRVRRKRRETPSFKQPSFFNPSFVFSSLTSLLDDLFI